MAHTLYHAKGCGSVAVQVALKVLDVPHRLVELDYDETMARTNKDTAEFQAFIIANPLAQFPTLVTPDGTVLTEIAACLLFLVEQHGAGTPWGLGNFTPSQLASFYRWMVFIPGNIYPLITLMEFPERFLEVPTTAACPEEAVHGWLKETVARRKKAVYLLLENHLVKQTPRLPGQFLLGTVMPTVLDIFVALVSHYAPWPRFDWLEENCSGLCSAVRETLKVPEIRDIFVANDLTAFVQ